MATPTTHKGLSKQAYNENPDTWGTGPLNTALDIIDACLGSVVTISTTGGATTLTLAQQQNLVLNVTGTLTANATLTFLSGVGGLFVIQNGTSGSFTLTAASAGGGASVTCAQGVRTIIISDGTNIRIADDRVGSPSGIPNAQLATAAAFTIKGNATASSANPSDNSLSTYLDLIGSTRGQILYRGTSGWTALGTGTAGYALVTNGVGQDPSWSSVGASRQGSYAALKIQVTSNTAVVLTADSITLFDGSASYQAALSFNTTLGTGTSGAGGIDTGTVAASTWYYVWAIAKPDGTKSAVLSTSSTSPTMPSGYTLKARVGTVRTDGSSALYRTLQYGQRAYYVPTASTNTLGYPQITSGTAGSGATTGSASPTYVTVSVSTFVPPTASEIGIVAQGAGISVSQLSVSGINGGYQTPGANGICDLLLWQSQSAQSWFPLFSTNIYWSSAQAAYVSCLGWTDNL